MKHVKTTMIASAIALSLGTANVLADSWTIVQEATLSNPTTINQTSTTQGSSVQAINNINIDGNALGGSSQTVTTDTNNLTLVQDGDTTTAKQAVNRISAGNVGTAGTPFEQSVVISSGGITLDQNGAGINNSQAVNDAVATTVVDLTQTLSPTGTSLIKLEQGIGDSTGTGNVQAVNRVKATTVTKLNQTISNGTNGSVTLDLNQAAGNATATNNIQAGNLIDASTAGDSLSTTADNVQQNIDIATLNMDQSAATSIQAGNALITNNDAAAVGTIKQSLDASTLTMNQTGANGSYQSGNYVGKKLW